MKVGKTDTKGSPVLGCEHGEKVVDGGTVSTTHKHATKQTNQTHRQEKWRRNVKRQELTKEKKKRSKTRGQREGNKERERKEPHERVFCVSLETFSCPLE